MTRPPASQRLSGKVCIVTGSSSGLGRAIARAYAREGGLLVCADLRQHARPDVEAESAVGTDELIRQQGGRALFVKADVSKADEVEAMVKAATAEYGRIDVSVPFILGIEPDIMEHADARLLQGWSTMPASLSRQAKSPSGSTKQARTGST